MEPYYNLAPINAGASIQSIVEGPSDTKKTKIEAVAMTHIPGAVANGTLEGTRVSAAPHPEVQKKNSEDALWECIGRQFDEESGGFCYESIIKPEVNTFPEMKRFPTRVDIVHDDSSKEIRAADEKIQKLSPAIQYHAFELAYLSEDPEILRLWERWLPYMDVNADEKARLLKAAPTLRYLGYAFACKGDTVHTKYPDAKLLHYRWNKLREKSPDLPELYFTSIDGSARVREFVHAHRTTSGVLSTGEEFIHDHQYHVILSILLILNPWFDSEKGITITYQSFKQDLNLWIGRSYDFVSAQRDKSMEEGNTELTEMLDFIEALISAVIDGVVASRSFEIIYRNSLRHRLDEHIKFTNYKRYFESKNFFKISVIEKVYAFFKTGRRLEDIVDFGLTSRL